MIRGSELKKRRLEEINSVLKLIKKIDGKAITSPMSDFGSVSVLKLYVLRNGIDDLSKSQILTLREIKTRYIRQAKGFL